VHYVDSSALLKLVLAEPESAALRERLQLVHTVSSTLLVTEMLRGARRSRPDGALDGQVDAALAPVRMIAIDETIVRGAGTAPPVGLRSLDAIHLATALRLTGRLYAFVCYDERLADAARAVGLRVEAPA